MTTNDRTNQDSSITPAAVARLLTQASACAWAKAEAEGPRSPLHLLGLGIHTASCQAVALLPAGVDLDGHPPACGDVAQLLRAAEELTRAIPIDEQATGISALVVAICDLVWEVTP